MTRDKIKELSREELEERYFRVSGWLQKHRGEVNLANKRKRKAISNYKRMIEVNHKLRRDLMKIRCKLHLKCFALEGALKVVEYYSCSERFKHISEIIHFDISGRAREFLKEVRHDS